MNLSDDRRILIGKTIAGVTVGASVISMVIIPILSSTSLLIDQGALTFGLFALGLGILAWVMVAAEPRNGAVWTIAWTSLFAALQVVGYAAIALWSRDLYPGLTSETLNGLSPSQLPLLAAIGYQVTGWSIVPAVWLPLTLGLLLFPDGRPPTPRWRWIGWGSVFGITASAIGNGLLQNPWSNVPIRSFGDNDGSWVYILIEGGWLLATALALVAAASLVVRFRRSTGQVRSQIGWIAWGGSFYFVVFFVGGMLFEGVITDPVANQLVFIAIQSVLLASYGVAITRYRLYDIDVVISRTLTYAVLVGCITGVYALIVVGVGTVVDTGSNLALSIVAVAVVAVAFEPFRVRVQRWVNRLVFGERATPYEVLAQATRRLADSTSAEETLAQIVDLVVAGTGASAAVLWMKTGDRLRPQSANTPEVLRAQLDVPLEADSDPRIPGDASVLVRHRRELLGAVSITKPRGQSVTGGDEKVLSDVAAGAGLLLRNISLNAELAERVDQLRASRRRLVEAHDAERHRLERNLHDGAQQQVVALKVKLGIARTLAGREGAERIAQIVESLAEDTQIAVDEMRAVAHGIYPPLLESEGLAAAVVALARSRTVQVIIDAGEVGRYDRSLEETVYFCLLETVNRATAAGARRISVRLADASAAVELTVRSDVPMGGLDTIVDRVDAFGGTVTLSSDDGHAVLTAELPAQPTPGDAGSNAAQASRSFETIAGTRP